MPENQMTDRRRFAVIDLEASSTKPKNRIIEAAVLILEDNGNTVSLIDSYSTLVNPEIPVPEDILQLTGITQEELDTAPKFFELAEDLELLTRDCTLVAHNISFDFDLLEEEFQKLGIDFQRKTKCTLELAKQEYPEFKSYDLKSLCELLSIDLGFNHRAMDDAIACAELFQMTYIKKLDSAREQTPSFTKIRKIFPALDLKFLGQLRPNPGVVHFSTDGETVYVERFENLEEEVPRYLLRFKEKYEEAEVDELQVVNFKDSLMAMREKEEQIAKLSPIFNIEERKTSWGVFLKENPFSLRAFPLFKGKGDLLFISNNKDDAVHWIHLQLDDIEKQEFAYIDQEDKRLINRLKKEREKQIRAKVKPFAQYPHDYFVVMGPGRDDDELSCHFFSGGKLSGHSFISGQAMFNLDAAPKDIKQARESEILKHYFLREFQDWKTRSRKDHSIKVLKTKKQAMQSREGEANGNQFQKGSDYPSRKKKKKKTNFKNNRNFKGKKKKTGQRPHKKRSGNSQQSTNSNKPSSTNTSASKDN